MRAIWIDAKSKTVSEVQVHTLEDWHRYVGCGYVEIAQRLSTGDALLVDEEGLLRKRDERFYFGGKLYVGNGLIVGRGDDDEAEVSVEVVRDLVVFP